MSIFAPIPEILNELKQGRMIVLVDDENRENEGDLVCAAEKITPEIINQMLSLARGYLCLSLTGKDCDRLDLTPQAAINTSMRSTAFTVSIDAHPRHGITTGVSAVERARTIRLAIDSKSTPSDFVRPGHINPLRAREGGVLVRTGQTEGSVDLARLAGLHPSAVIIEIMREDGQMARLPDLEILCRKHNLKLCSVADVIEYRLQRESLISRLQPIQGVPVTTPEGEFNLLAYRSIVDPLPHIVLTLGGVGENTSDESLAADDQPTLVRVHSRDVLGDVFGVPGKDGDLSSRDLLHQSMRMIQNEGRGAVVYLRPSTVGAEKEGPLLQRLHNLQFQSGLVEEEIDAPDLISSQGVGEKAIPAVKRDFGIGGQILRDLGLKRLRVLTNHPRSMHALASFGIEIVEHVPITFSG